MSLYLVQRLSNKDAEYVADPIPGEQRPNACPFFLTGSPDVAKRFSLEQAQAIADQEARRMKRCLGNPVGTVVWRPVPA